MALLSTISPTENVALTKINANINTTNLISGGLVGQGLVKNSDSDFDYTFADSPFRVNSTTSLTIGLGTKEFIITNCPWDQNFTFRVFAGSQGSGGNGMYGTIYCGTSAMGAQTWTMTVDKVDGSGTFDDWQFRVIAETSDSAFVVNTTSSNSVFQTLYTPANCTYNNMWASVAQYGKLTTVSGVLQLTANNSSFNRNSIFLGYLADNFAIAQGNSGRFVMGTANVSVSRTYLGVVENYSSAGWVDNYNEPSSTTSTGLYLTFRDAANATVANGDVFNYNFSITYLAD
jgi:hypothetical protein